MDGVSNNSTLRDAPSHLNVSWDFSVHRYLPFAVLYFFFNHVGLPNGLFLTTIFSPVLFVWLYLKGQHWLTTKFLLYLSPFIVAQAVAGVSSSLFFLRSTLLLWTVYVAVYALCLALLKSDHIDRLFDQSIILNFCAALFAVATVKTPLSEVLWTNDSNAVADLPHLLRLRMLTTEPSVYSELMLPLLIFAALRFFRDSKARNLLYFMMILVPLLLSQSFGGLSIGFAGIAITLFARYRRLLKRPKTLVIVTCAALAVAAVLLTPNPIAQRVMQVATGGDSSTKSRTLFAFVVGYTVAASKSLWWGAGLGQGKLVDVSNLGIGFDIGTVPNSVAGTLAELGLVGVFTRFSIEIYLFFRTKVYRSSFRLAMFVVTFIVQVTGSHLMDVQQYLMWCMAFLPILPEPDPISLSDGRFLNPKFAGANNGN